MDLPAPLSCFSRGFARPTSSLANSVICACANLCRAKNRSGHGRTGRSGCYGPAHQGTNKSEIHTPSLILNRWNSLVQPYPVKSGCLMNSAPDWRGSVGALQKPPMTASCCWYATIPHLHFGNGPPAGLACFMLCHSSVLVCSSCKEL